MLVLLLSSLPDESIQPERKSPATRSISPDPDARRPAVADGRISGAARIPLNRDRVNGSRSGAHAAINTSAFKGRSCRTGTSHEEIGIAENDLTVRADIDEKAGLFLVFHKISGENTGGNISPHVTANTGGEGNEGFWVNVQARFNGPEMGNLQHGRRVGLQPQIFRLEPEKEMRHDRITRYAAAGYIFFQSRGILKRLLDETVH